MPITLGGVTFDKAHTAAAETYAEVGGRDMRKIVVSGLIVGEHSAADIEARLDAILDAASAEDFSAPLSLRAGRRLWVRREAFARDVARDALVGSFTLTLEAKDSFERAAAATSRFWTIAASGATLALTTNGNVFSQPVITLAALGTLVNPSCSDGARAIAYAGTVAAGQTLVFDAPAGRVTLDGADVTPYTSGLFPRIAPEGVTLTYTDDTASSHSAAAMVSFHDRWW